MADFKSSTSFIKCDHLKIGEKSWPKQYNQDNSYLKFTNANGLEWFAASDALNNVDGGEINDYIVMNQQKGGSGVTLSANTSSFIRAGPGQLVGASTGGGPDGKGTGITYTPRGQITIGLTEEDADEGSTDINIHGSSLKQHTSMSDREFSIVGDKTKLQYPSHGEKLFQESPLSIKITGDGIFKKENNSLINEKYKSETLPNKILINTKIGGEILFPKNKNNVEYGVDSGNKALLLDTKELDGTFKNHKVVDENLSLEENEYKNWTVETIINDKKESHIIEEYNVGYQKLYGTFSGYNNPVDGENSFKYNDYYNGWNLSVSAYQLYNTSNTSEHIIRPGTTFKLTKGSDVYYEKLTKVCKTNENILFFENSQENYNNARISIEGIPDNTSVSNGQGTSTITLSNQITSFIPSKTNVVFTDTGNNNVGNGIIENDVEIGQTTITLSSPSPNGTYTISIKPFNTTETILTKIDYSEKIVNYTIKNTEYLQSNTSITEDINNTSTTIVINLPTINVIPSGTSIYINNQTFTITSEVSLNSTNISVSYIGGDNTNWTVLAETPVYIRSFIAERLINTDDLRGSELSKNNTIKNLSKQDVGSKFYISSQNKEHENGIIYGDRIGKLLDDRKLNIYHRENEGFYVGWSIYLWNTKIPLNKNLTSDIKSGTVITFVNPLDSTDTLDITLDVDTTVSSPNIITIPTSSVTEKNLNGFTVNIKGFSNTTVSSHTSVTETTVANETEQLALTPQIGDVITRTSDSTTYIYNGGSSSSMTGYTLIPTTSANVSRVTLSNSITSGVLPDFSRVVMVSGSNTKYFKVCTYDNNTNRVTLISDSSIGDLTGYSINVYGLLENTTVNLTYGIIEGYNSRLNKFQVLLNYSSYILDNNTFYCIKKGYTELDNGENYYISLDGDKIINNNYYNNWKIEVESGKNNGYYGSSSDYIISDYKKEKLVNDYLSDYSGILVNTSIPLTLESELKPIEADYFKGWRIGISNSLIDGTNPDFSDSTTVKGYIVSHSASIHDTSIPSNTIITNTTTSNTGPDNSLVSVLTIEPELTSAIATNTNILVTDVNGVTFKLKVFSSTTSVITLRTNETISFVGGVVFMLTNISNVVVQWDDSTPNLSNTNLNYLITYNNLQWSDTNKRTLLYKTLKAEHISSDSNDNNSNKVSGFGKLQNHSDSNITTTTNRIKLLSNTDTGLLTDNVNVLETDLSPPSSEDNHYKGWKITLKFAEIHQTFNIIKYSGTTKIAILDGTINKPDQTYTVSAYILTKNLKHQGLINDLFEVDTYVTNVDLVNNVLTLNNSTKTPTIDDFRTILLSPPRVFKSRTTISNMTNSGTTYTEITLNSTMDSLIKGGVGVELISKENNYKTTVYEDATALNTVKLTYTNEINSIITGNTKDDYIINVIGEGDIVPIKSIDSNNNAIINLETNSYYENVVGWYVSLYNDRKYKIYYDIFSGTADISDGGLGFDLSNKFSEINDFYKNWTIQLEEYFDQINETLDSQGNRVEETFTRRKTFTINEYLGNNKKIPISPPGYTGAVRPSSATPFSLFMAYLIPSKTIKYGDNINNPTTNTTKYKLISNYKTDKNKLTERGLMQKENTLSVESSDKDDYYNGWEIITYNTITNNNDKLIFTYNGDEKVISLKHGSYSGADLAQELKLKLDSVTNVGDFTVTFSENTNKMTIDAASSFAFKWKKTHENYLTKLHKTLGFQNTDDTNYPGNTVTSNDKISLYIIEYGESSIIEKYNGSTKSFTTSSLRSKKSMRSIGTKTTSKTQYIVIPPEHISGKLNVKSSNNIKLNKNKSINTDNYYNGWEIVTYNNGNYQSSYITEYDSITNKITCPSLNLSNIYGDNTYYFLRNEKHMCGLLRKNIKTIFPGGNKKGVLSVSDITIHTFNNSSNDEDPTGVSISLYKDPTTNFKWFGLPQPSTVDDYYNDWKISIYVNNIEYHSTIRKYYASDYRIILDDINHEIFLEEEQNTEIVFRYILYEPDYYMLSFNAIPVDHYYNGWMINVSNGKYFYSSIVSDYNGKDRKIIADSLPDHLDDTYTYELIENLEGVMSDTLKLSYNSSEILNYYVGWNLSTIDSNGNITNTSKITTYNPYSKGVTLDPVINGTDSTTKYKLYLNSDNSIFGKSSGKNIYTGSRNIVIGSNAGPLQTENSLSDKLYIDSDTNTRGSNSFIYGNMSRGSEELNVNADLRIPDSKMIYGDITGSSTGTSTFQTVNINGGSINGTTIGEGVGGRSTGKFTNIDASGNLTVTGDFTVTGITTTIDSTNLVVEDPLIKLARNNTEGDTFDIGIFGQYKDGTDKYTGIFRDASDSGRWKLFTGLTTEPGNTSVGDVTPGTNGYTTGTLVSNIEGNVDGIVGGTTPAAVTGTTITANTKFSGLLDGEVGGAGATPAAITGTTITANSEITANAGISVKNGNNGSGFIKFYEDGDSGSAGVYNYIELQCPASLDSHSTLTLPSTGGILVSRNDVETVSPGMLEVVSGLSAQTYGSSTAIPVLTLDTKGRVTVATTTPISTTLDVTGDNSGSTTVSMQDSDNQNLRLSGTSGVISTAVTNQEVTFNLINTGVTAATYGTSTGIPVIQVDAHGRIVSASTSTISGVLSDVTQITYGTTTDGLKVGRSSETLIDFSDADEIVMRMNDENCFIMEQTAGGSVSSPNTATAGQILFSPISHGIADLGKILENNHQCWRGLHLSETGFIKFKRNNSSSSESAIYIQHTTGAAEDKLTVKAIDYTADVTLKTVGYVEATNSIRLIETSDATNGSHIGIKAPTTVSSSYDITLPASTPTNSGSFLKAATSGSGTLEWSDTAPKTQRVRIQMANTNSNFRIPLSLTTNDTNGSVVTDALLYQAASNGKPFYFNPSIGKLRSPDIEVFGGGSGGSNEGGIIYLYGAAKTNGLSNPDPPVWRIFAPGKGTSHSTTGNPNESDTNFVISNHSMGLESPASYNDNIVIGNLAKARGNRNTVLGSEAGYNGQAHSTDNTFIGYKTGSYATSILGQNTLIGSYSGRGISGNTNIVLGYNSGWSSDQNSDKRLIIDCKLQPQGDESLIYGDQSASQGQLTFNAVLHVQDASSATSGVTGTIQLYDKNNKSGGKYVGIKAPDTLNNTSYTITLPDAVGSNGEVLTTDGSGNLSWGESGSSDASDLTSGTLSDNRLPDWITSNISGTASKLSINGLGGVSDLYLTMTSTFSSVVSSSHTPGQVGGQLGVPATASKRIKYNPSSGIIHSEDLKIGHSTETLIDFTTDDQITFRANGEDCVAVYQTAGETNGTPDTAATAEIKFAPIRHNIADLGSIGVNNSQCWRSICLSESGEVTFKANGTASNANKDRLLHSNGQLLFEAANYPDDVTFKTEGNIEATKEIRLIETSNINGDHVAIKAPTSLSGDYTLTLPSDAGTDGYVLKTNGSGTLSWINSVFKSERIKLNYSNSNAATTFKVALTSNVASTSGNSVTNAMLYQAASDGKQIFYNPGIGALRCAQYQGSADSSDSNSIYNINFPKGSNSVHPATSWTNIQITNNGRGISDLTASNGQYGNTMIGYNMPTNPGHRNTLIGEKAGSSLTQASNAEHGGENTFIGSEAGIVTTTGSFNVSIGLNSGRTLTTGNDNTFIGLGAGYRISSGTRNICIGKDVGPTNTSNGDDYRLYIDARTGYAGTSSFIYGNQSTAVHTLKINADVTISDSTSTSNGNLTVDGNIKISGGGSLMQHNSLAALTFDGNGNITRIGYNNNPSNGQFLKWDGNNNRVVWDTVSSGSTTTDASDLTSGTLNDARLPNWITSHISGASNLQAIHQTTSSDFLNVTMTEGTNTALNSSSNMSAGDALRVPTSEQYRLRYQPSTGILKCKQIIYGSATGESGGLKIGRHAQTLIDFSTVDKITFRANNEDCFAIVQTANNSTAAIATDDDEDAQIRFSPLTDGVADLGRRDLCFRALQLADTGFIRFRNSSTHGHDNQLLLKHSQDKLTFSASGNDHSGSEPTFKSEGHLEASKSLRLRDPNNNTGNYYTLKAPTSLGGSYTLTLPGNQGVNGAALKTNGSGSLAWSDIISYSNTTKVLHEAGSNDHDITFVSMSTNTNAYLVQKAVNTTVNNRLTYNPGTGKLRTPDIEVFGTTNSNVGGEIFFYGPAKTNGASSEPPSWRIFSPGSQSYGANDANLVISNHSLGLQSPTSYSDVIVIGNLTKTRGSFTTVVGAQAGSVANSSMNHNTLIGYKSGSYATMQSSQNTLIGSQSGLGISGDSNICIGYNTGYSSDQTADKRLIIDCSGNSTPQGTNSLIYGDQSASQGKLTFNAVLHVQDTSGTSNTDTGTINLYDNNNISGGRFVGIKAPASMGSDYTITLPDTLGTTEQVLTLDGNSGATEWRSITFATTSNRIHVRGSGVSGTPSNGDFPFAFLGNSAYNTGGLLNPGASTTKFIAQNYFDSSGGTDEPRGMSWNPSTAILKIRGSIRAFAKDNTEAGYIRLYSPHSTGSGGGYINIEPHASTTSSGWTLTLPSNVGSTGQVLTTANSTGGTQWNSFTNVCFLAGTKITLENNIKVNIENISKGDRLLSYKLDDMPPCYKSADVLSWFSEEDNGEFSDSVVTNIWSNISSGYIILNDKLHVTHEHLIFTAVDEEYTWLSAKEIRVGDFVFTDEGKYEEITKIERVKKEVEVFNIKVNSFSMNYFASSYLVHSASLCDECASKNNKL